MSQPFAGLLQITDASGVPVDGALVYTYEAGTFTPKAVFTTPALDVAQPNPMPCPRGKITFFLGSGSYRIRVTDATGVELPQYAQDDVTAPISGGALASAASAAAGAGLVGFDAALAYAAATVGRALADIVRAEVLADSHATIQAALDYAATLGGADVRLAPGKTYTLTTGLNVPSNCGIVGDGTPKIYAPASVFTNTSLSTKYTASSAVIRAQGGLSSPFTALTNVRFRGFKIESEVSDGRMVDAIAARNITGFEATNLEIWGFPVGCGIRASSLRGRILIDAPYIHDFTTAAVWATQPQITGIEIDGDRVNSVASQGVVIRNPRIADLTMTGSALSTWGFQTDGINFQGVDPNPTTLCVVIAPVITNVGEGIDNFGSRNVFIQPVLRDCYDYGMKFVHGASYNNTIGGNISKCGRAGVGLFGSGISGVGDTERNHFADVFIEDIDPSNRGPSNPACFAIDDNGGSTGKVRTTTVTGGSWSCGANGEFGLCDTGTGNENLFTDVAVFTGASTGKKIRVDSGSSVVRLAGSTGYRTDDSAPTISSGGAIAPVADVSFVSGTAAVATVDVPLRLREGGSITLIPTGLWTLTAAGNIAVAASAVVSKAMTLTYDKTTNKWYPSY